MAYQGKITEYEFIQLVNNCNDRGGHSWGSYFKNTKTQNELLLKGLGHIPIKYLLSLYKDFDLCLTMSRLSTTYKIDLEHSQPFLLDGRYIIHNGVVKSYNGSELDSLKVFDAIENNEDIGAVIWIENNTLLYHEDLIKLYKKNSKNSTLISSKKI